MQIVINHNLWSWCIYFCSFIFSRAKTLSGVPRSYNTINIRCIISHRIPTGGVGAKKTPCSVRSGFINDAQTQKPGCLELNAHQMQHSTHTPYHSMVYNERDRAAENKNRFIKRKKKHNAPIKLANAKDLVFGAYKMYTTLYGQMG